ncbi:MAG: metallophosphoesterase family protein [Deltaproteobacteria bacterium]|nr:metallophosphoesterase family protein [Deltaproteobacteria bacterium]
MNRLVGIMADSHGDASAIEGAIGALSSLGCQSLVHLGDVCDSSRPESADRCVSILRENGVSTVKGNNDHMVVANRDGLDLGDVSPETVAWLKALPLKIRIDGAAFVHSLPFVRELGLSAMVRGMGKKEMAFYLGFPHRERLLFRGHNHDPCVVCMEDGRLSDRVPAPGQKIELRPGLAFIVTCGALINGLCMVWDQDRHAVTSLSL